MMPIEIRLTQKNLFTISCKWHTRLAGIPLNFDPQLLAQKVRLMSDSLTLFSSMRWRAGRTRTCAILLRRQMLYPTELRAHRQNPLQTLFSKG